MIVGSNLISGLNYIYHFLMGRLLGPASYGELASLFSLIGLLGIITLSLGLVVVKYVSAATTREEVSSLVTWINKNIFIFSAIFFSIILLNAPGIANFLNITDTYLVYLIAVVILFGFPASFNRAILQGLMKFKEIIFNGFIENLIKLILGITLVYFGFSVGGAVAALVLSTLIGCGISYYLIKDYLGKIIIKPNIKPILKYSIPVIVQSAAITSIYSTDVVLVKHFLSAYDSGLYAALSNLGKIIFFAAGPVSSVMFPIVSSRQAKGHKYEKIFIYSFLITLALSLTILVIYWIAPDLAILLLFGSLYLEAASLLLPFGIFMTLFTLSSLIINFYLSLGHTKIVVFPVIAALAQISGIWFYHSDIEIIIKISIMVTTLLLMALLVYIKYGEKINFGDSSSFQAGKDYS